MRINFINILKKRLILLAYFALIAGSTGILWGESVWFLELFSHFVPHYCALFILASWCATQKLRYFWLTWAVASALWLILPLPTAANANTPVFQAIWYNVNLDNPQPESETAVLLKENSDILALAEIDMDDVRWHNLRQHYPHGCSYRSDSPFALAVWAKQPLNACVIHMVADEYPYIRADIQGVALYVLHPPPPITAELAQNRQQYLQQVAQKIALENNVLVLGDLNSSPYSPIFRRFQATADIRPHTPNYLPTWRPFGLNIDHVLSRQHQGYGVNVRALDWGHSDHRGLWVAWYKTSFR